MRYLDLFCVTDDQTMQVEPNSPYIKVHKTVVNFSYDKIVRKFEVSRYGSLQLAKVAAIAFEKETLSIVRDFNHLTKKPDARKIFLSKFGWPEDRSCKRNIDGQRSFVVGRLCDGKVDGVEAKMYQAIVRHSVPSTCQKKCFLSMATGGGFKAILSGKDQVLEQTFKNINQASTWLAQMAQADEDGCEIHVLGLFWFPLQTAQILAVRILLYNTWQEPDNQITNIDKQINYTSIQI